MCVCVCVCVCVCEERYFHYIDIIFFSLDTLKSRFLNIYFFMEFV